VFPQVELTPEPTVPPTSVPTGQPSSAPSVSAQPSDFILGSISGNASTVTDNDDSPDTPSEEVIIMLLNEDGDTIAAIEAHADGDCTFTGISVGTYTVMETTPTGQISLADADGPLFSGGAPADTDSKIIDIDLAAGVSYIHF